MQNIEDYFALNNYANQLGYKRTICNIRKKIPSEFSKIIRLVCDSIKEDVKNNSTFEEFIFIYKDNKFLHNILNSIQDVKYCDISSDNNITISIVNINNLNGGKNIDFSPYKQIHNMNITTINKNKNSQIIYNYLHTNNNTYYKNIKKKNKKKNNSICQWRSIYIHKKKENKFNNKLNIKSEKENVSSNITIEDCKITTKGRTLLPGTILFTFVDKNRISFKDNWIQFIPSKPKDNSKFQSIILNLIKFIQNIIIFKINNLDIENKDKIINYFNCLSDDINYNCDYVLPLDNNLINPQINKDKNIKNHITCYTIKNIKNMKQLNEIDNNIKNKNKKYSLFTEKLKNYEYNYLLKDITDTEIKSLINILL